MKSRNPRDGARASVNLAGDTEALTEKGCTGQLIAFRRPMTRRVVVWRFSDGWQAVLIGAGNAPVSASKLVQTQAEAETIARNTAAKTGLPLDLRPVQHRPILPDDTPRSAA